PHGRRRDLGEPEIRRPSLSLPRFDRDASVGRDQRKLAFKRGLRREDNPQRRPFPRCDRRRQHCDLGRILAGARRTFGLRGRYRKKDGKCSCDRHQGPESSSKLMCTRQLSPPSSHRSLRLHTITKALAESWQIIILKFWNGAPTSEGDQ